MQVMIMKDLHEKVKSEELIKAILFDVDGVIVDSMPYHFQAWKRAFFTVGIKIGYIDICKLEGMRGGFEVNPSAQLCPNCEMKFAQE